MRLLTLTNGRFELTSFPVGKVPPYAILSHTWGRGEDDEVTFQDITAGHGSTKRGYGKLLFCSRQAREHGLDFCWVDTCCIDKSSSSELTESINSMFRWYQQAKRCYAYLADVCVHDANGQRAHAEWELAFRHSRWFTRGWTLQELLAPRHVEFYSREGLRLGDKESLVSAIRAVTGIDEQVLRGGRLDGFGIDERLRWAQNRRTTRAEDKAYSLLGICGVYMPLIYGEGEENAFRRLRQEAASGTAQAPAEAGARSVMPLDPNPHFVGRADELSRLETLLFNHSHTARAALVGLGGIGKTQVAIELVHRRLRQRQDCMVFWLVATDVENLQQSYRAVADRLAIPGRDAPGADIISLVAAHLSQASTAPWLLVLDNADDMHMWTRPAASVPTGAPAGALGRPQQRLANCLPKHRHGSILVTTRNRKLAVKLARQHLVALAELPPLTSLQLLQAHLAHPQLSLGADTGEALLQTLTYLPLAIVQAAAYINVNGITVADYLALFAEQDETAITLLSEDFEDEGRYDSIKNPITTTWLISFKRIRTDDPVAADYLSFLACVDPKNMLIALLPGGHA